MNLHQLFFVNNPCYQAHRTITVQGIMVHSTAANNPRLSRYVGPDDGLLGVNKYNNHWNNPIKPAVCVHAFIGKLADGTIATYQTLPWNYRGWHSGGAANDSHISFEICEDALTDPVYFFKVYQEAVELCSFLCKIYNLDPLKDGVIIGHYEGYKRGIASNHADPSHWFPKHGKSMDKFRADVKAQMVKNATPPAPPVTPEVKPTPVTPTKPTPTPEPVAPATKPAEPEAPATKVVVVPAKPVTGVVTPKIGLNIRCGPGINYKKVGALFYGTKITIHEMNSDKTWYRISAPKFPSGWVCAEYVKLDNPADANKNVIVMKTTTTDLHLRTGRGTNYPAITVIPKGTLVEVSELVSNWYMVKYKGYTGYSYSPYLK